MDAFTQFLLEVRSQVEAAGGSSEQMVYHVAEMLDELLTNEELGFAGSAEPGAHHAELLYQDPRTSFVAVLMTWGPGSSTSVHSHNSWDVFGVLEESVEVTNFVRSADGEPEPVACFRAYQGDVTYLVPPEQAIHQIRNPNERVAVTLHIYGTESDI